MLKISDYAVQIDNLYYEGKSAFEIHKILGFKYVQPVYNYFKKKGWDRLKRENFKYKVTYQVDETFFEIIDTEEKAYILGFICADGHIDGEAYRITIALQESDSDILYKIRDCMQSTHPIKHNIKKENPYKKSDRPVLEQCSLSVNGKKLITPLINMGLAGKKTYTLDSSIMQYVPKELWKHFLRGYIDGDGNITWKKHYNSGYKYLLQVCGNEDFLNGSFQEYFHSNCNIYKFKTSKQCCIWKLSDKKEILLALNDMYGNAKIYLDRKYKIYQYAMWSCKTELIAGNSYFIKLIEGQSAANPLVKCLRQVQRLADETILNPYEEGSIEYNSATNARHLELQENLDEDIVRTI